MQGLERGHLERSQEVCRPHCKESSFSAMHWLDFKKFIYAKAEMLLPLVLTTAQRKQPKPGHPLKRNSMRETKGGNQQNLKERCRPHQNRNRSPDYNIQMKGN